MACSTRGKVILVSVLTAGFSANGLPLGVQLAAAPFQDRLVLAAGQAFQAATEWVSRRPVLEADDGPALEAYALPAPALPRQSAMQDEARLLAGLVRGYGKVRISGGHRC